MNCPYYHNVPSEQRPVQRLVDQFNDDEQRWRRLTLKSLRRCQRHPNMPDEWHKLLDQIESARSFILIPPVLH